MNLFNELLYFLNEFIYLNFEKLYFNKYIFFLHILIYLYL
jgi:hypothetical protein